MEPNRFWDTVIGIALDDERRTPLLLTFSLYANLAYALLKLISGLVVGSFWLGALGMYYATLALMRFSLLRSLERPGRCPGRVTYRRTAWGLGFLTLVMGGIYVLLLRSDGEFSYPSFLIYAMALYAFVKIISATISLITRRRERRWQFAAARCVSFTAALMSIQALQSALLERFNTQDPAFTRLMNGIVGLAILLMQIALVAGMLLRSGKGRVKR